MTIDTDVAETLSYLLEPIVKFPTGHAGLSYDYVVGEMIWKAGFPPIEHPMFLLRQPWATFRACVLRSEPPDDLGGYKEDDYSEIGYSVYCTDEAAMYDWLVGIGMVSPSDIPELKRYVDSLRTLALLPEE